MAGSREMTEQAGLPRQEGNEWGEGPAKVTAVPWVAGMWLCCQGDETRKRALGMLHPCL